MPREQRPSPIDDRVRIAHMLEAARDILGYCRGRSRSDLDSDSMLTRAIVNALQQIGEAAARTSEPSRARVPGLPWGQIVAMRHVLVHVYWGVDLDRVWATIESDIPAMISSLERACEDWPLPDPPRD